MQKLVSTEFSKISQNKPLLTIFFQKFGTSKKKDDIAMKASARELLFHEISENLKFSMKLSKKSSNFDEMHNATLNT